MKTQDWFKGLLTSLKDTFDFRFEAIVLKITEKICENMKAKNISRTELAQRLKISPPAVTKILNGNSNFKLKTLLSLSDALDLELVIDLKEKNKYLTAQVCSYTSLITHTVEAYPVTYIIPSESELGITTPGMGLYAPMATNESVSVSRGTAYKLPEAA